MKTHVLTAAALAAAFTVGLAQAQTTPWPRHLDSSAGDVTVYQPQIDSFSGNQLTAHAAVSVAEAAGKEPVFGAVFFTAAVSTDRGTDEVTVNQIHVTNSRFPSDAQMLTPAVTQALTEAGDQDSISLSQSQLLAQLALTQKEQAAAANLDNTPPRILFESQPTVLVTIDGEPKLVQATGSSLMTVVNTPFFIALDPSTRTYYLHGGGQWLSTSDIMNGPWDPTSNVPAAVTQLAASQPQASQQESATPNAGGMSQVIVATQPTEIIQTTGPAEYGPIDNTNLLYVTNTDSDVFMDIDSQSLYVLLSGRWFTAPSQAGPWTYVPAGQLPADFSHIPPGLPVSNALASVPGTQAAKDAVLDAQVPQTAAIKRNAAGPNVSYSGDPKFQPVSDGSKVSYAVNTSSSVVKVEKTYYACSDGVWFQADSPVGPWAVSIAVPQVIYTIPPTCPIYPVTYCQIYSYTPDVVYCGYLPGYTGSYVYGGAVVYGTGWPYDPWFGTAFIPRPVTWGFGATFSMGWGCWGFGVGAGWGAASFGCGWNSGWWGCGNYHWNNWNWNSNWNQNVNVTRNVTNNITNNTYNGTVNRTANNIYRNNPNRLTPQEQQRLENNENRLERRNASLQNQIDRERQAGTAAANEQRQKDQEQENRDKAQEKVDRHELAENHPDDRHPTAAERQANEAAQQRREDQERAERQHEQERDNVYADHDGNVYRHNDEGWQHREQGQWQQPHANDESYRRNQSELNHQFAARQRGYGGGGGRRR
jgi:hypothetical protein